MTWLLGEFYYAVIIVGVFVGKSLFKITLTHMCPIVVDLTHTFPWPSYRVYSRRRNIASPNIGSFFEFRTN